MDHAFRECRDDAGCPACTHQVGWHETMGALQCGLTRAEHENSSLAPGDRLADWGQPALRVRPYPPGTVESLA